MSLKKLLPLGVTSLAALGVLGYGMSSLAQPTSSSTQSVKASEKGKPNATKTTRKQRNGAPQETRRENSHDAYRAEDRRHEEVAGILA